jgi:hypothetical protein
MARLTWPVGSEAFEVPAPPEDDGEPHALSRASGAARRMDIASDERIMGVLSPESCPGG